MQETACNCPYEAPCGYGAGRRLHHSPFHISIKGRVGPPPCSENPTAVQKFRVVQETADVLVPIAPGRSGVDWMRQRVPLHISANASTDGRAVTSEPTALQEDAEPQDTAANPLLVGLPDPPLGAVPGAALASLPSAGTLVT